MAYIQVKGLQLQAEAGGFYVTPWPETSLPNYIRVFDREHQLVIQAIIDGIPYGDPVTIEIKGSDYVGSPDSHKDRLRLIYEIEQTCLCLADLMHEVLNEHRVSTVG